MFELSHHDPYKPNGNTSRIASTFLNNHRKRLISKRNLSLHQLRSNSNRSSVQEVVENAAFYQIASLIPDEVLLNSSDYSVRIFESAILFADISGFTDLSEKYQNLENGASKLSAVLNVYLGIMVQEILSHGGDIIKYSGDAFVACFRKESQTSMQESIHNAIDTAIIIQKNCRNFLTEVGVILNVKIAISCGEVDFQLIGNDSSSQYVIIGDPVWQIKILQDFIQPGEILITWKAFYYTQESFYTYEIMRDHRCYRITGFKEQISLIRRQYEATMNFQEMHKNLSKNIEARSTSNVMLEPGFDTLSFSTNQNELFSLRQKVGTVTSIEIRKDLRKFIITPLLNAIDMGDSIDALTEMRNVVIVFANFIVPHKNSKELLFITDKIYTKVYEIVNSYEGVLNKVILFDKDMMFLNIFGLKGMQHENGESAIGLRCAYELHEAFKTWKDISIVSIGVTTGKSYCGVVGHTLRREYSVISVTVNRAARLMIAYPNIVSCDKETLIESKISFGHFHQLPGKPLKGISGIISVYEFFGLDSSNEDDIDQNENEILYGMSELLRILRKTVTSAIIEYNSGNFTGTGSCFVIKGERGEGKSKILNFLYRDFLRQNVKCLKLSLNTKHSTMMFWTVKYCFAKIIETEYGKKSRFEKKIEKIFQHLNIQKFLYLLNEIIDTNFDRKTNFEDDPNEAQRTEIQKNLISILCKNFKNFWIILIDDADYMDSHSLKFLNSIIMSHSVFFIFTIDKNLRKWTLKHKKFIKNEYLTQYKLKPIDKKFQKNIACQSIDVLAIPIELERFLHRNSHGNAGWIETCTKSLLYSGKLKIEGLSYLQAVRDGMIMKDGLDNKDIEHNDFFNINPTTNGSQCDEKIINVAVIEGVLSQKDYIARYKHNKLMVYDTLSSYDQMICKCASVIGPKFRRGQLNYLITKIDHRLVGKTISKLFQLNILFCANQNEEVEENICVCKNVEIFESCRDLPRYSNCSFLSFNDELFRKFIYDTLTEKQRVEYHTKSLNFLCRMTRKCSSCNHKKFEFFEEISMNFHDGYVKKSCERTKMKENNFLKLLTLEACKFNGMSKKPAIVLNYLNYEYRNCTCKFLLSLAFNDIVRHCQGKDMIMKKIFSQIMSADLSIRTGNIPNAMDYLNSTMELLGDRTIFSDENFLLSTYFRGRAYILRGYCFEAIEKNHQALDCYYDACAVFKISFPRKFNFLARAQQFFLIQKIKILLNINLTKSALTRIQILIIHESSILLGNLFNLYTKIGEIKLAKLAAVWALKDALQSNREISLLASSFKNFLTSRASLSIKSFDKKIFREIFESNLCQNIDKDGLKRIIELYITFMEHQIYRQNINIAIKFGEYAKKICYNLGNHEALLKVIPPLFILHLKSVCVENCYKLLQELHYSIKFNNSDENAKFWVYALSIDLCLDTKYGCIVEYEECRNIYMETLLAIGNEDHSEGYLRFIINFNLWTARIVQRTVLKSSVIQIIEKSFRHGNMNFNQIFTGIRTLELLQFYLDQDDENFIRLKKLYEFLKARLKDFVK